MKKFLFFIFTSLLFSCDKIDGDERFIPSGVEVALNNRVVLVEDYTGQACTFCPAAADVLHTLAENEYKDKMIIVSMHAGGLAMNTPLFNSVAQQYYSAMGFSANPTIWINRQDKKHSTSDSDWGPWILEELNSTLYCDIKSQLSYNSADRAVSIMSDIDVLEDIKEVKLGIQYFIIEDSIVSPQKGNGVTYPDYVHHNVFRDAVNGLWGVPFVETSGDIANLDYPKGSHYKYFHANYKLDDAWNADNIYVVSFVFKYTNDESNQIGEVLQANIVKLVDDNVETVE